MANDLIQRKYYIVDTEDSLPSEIVDGSIYYVKGNNALYIDMSSTRRRINPDYSNKLDANQGYINAGKSLSIDDNGNVVPVENINIDPTLKNQGQAADAKITGQALGELYDYFEGLQQIIENLDGPTTVTTDATLSNQGVPADAKATGDELSNLRDGLNETVRFTAQSLTDEQKEQARENLGISNSVDNISYSNHTLFIE